MGRPGVAQELLKIKDVLRTAGKHCGIIGTSEENLNSRIQQKFRMLGLGIDARLLIRSIQKLLASIGRTSKINPSLTQGTDTNQWRGCGIEHDSGRRWAGYVAVTANLLTLGH